MNNVIYDDFQDWLYNPHNPINSVHQGGFPNMGGPPMISPPHSLPPQHRESMDTSFEEPMQVSTTGDTYMDCDSSEVGQTRSNGHIYMHATDGSWYYMYRYQLSNNNVHYTSNSEVLYSRLIYISQFFGVYRKLLLSFYILGLVWYNDLRRYRIWICLTYVNLFRICLWFCKWRSVRKVHLLF